MLSCGIIGLPNVGKSTLFNALLKKQQALAANYPFTTIEPNVGIVPVPDVRLEKLAEVVAGELSDKVAPFAGSRNDLLGKLPPLVPATVEFVDIAGLVKGAHEGAGLGNKFLSHIREVAIIAHVVRAFEDENIVKEGAVDPKTDYQTIQTELALADLATLEKINVKKHESGIKNYEELINGLKKELNTGILVRNMKLSLEEQDAIKDLFLLSSKPEVVVLNVSEQDYNSEKIPHIIQKYSNLLFSVTANEMKQSQEIASSFSAPRNDNMVVISAKIEEELASLSEEEQRQYLEDLGLSHSGLERLIQKAYQTLGLISFLTAGEKEVRAWTIKKGTNAQNAAGEIHTDFIKGFIKAEVISFEDFVAVGGWKKARELGKSRFEGKDYGVKDGEVVEFKIGR